MKITNNPFYSIDAVQVVLRDRGFYLQPSSAVVVH